MSKMYLRLAFLKQIKDSGECYNMTLIFLKK
jgi:hypothetical protein